MRLNDALAVLNSAADQITEKYCDVFEDDEITEEYLDGALDGIQTFNEVIMAILQEMSEIQF